MSYLKSLSTKVERRCHLLCFVTFSWGDVNNINTSQIGHQWRTKEIIIPRSSQVNQ